MSQSLDAIITCRYHSAMRNIIALVGLSGSGKSTVGPLLAARLGWHFVDTDASIATNTGATIGAIFDSAGEAAFRRLESEALAAALKPYTVVATGGGVLESGSNRAMLAERAIVVWLAASPTTLTSRLGDANDRPLLAGDLLTRLTDLADRRSATYAAAADCIIKVDHRTPGEATADIQQLWDRLRPRGEIAVTAPGGSYDIVIEPGALDQLPDRLQELGLNGTAWLVGDANTLPLYAPTIEHLFSTVGRRWQSLQIPAGERAKTMATVGQVHDWMLTHGVERGDVLLALGGGVVGDLAGFAAATVLRGIALVHLPTTVIAIVDSAIGGKTGVDHAAGKNLIGAFYQPRLVLSDTRLLGTLSLAERTSGWTEAIKHGMIGDARLFNDLAANVDRIRDLAEPQLTALLRRAAAFKARIVSGDEREAGDRILLNYGHTIGHALEAWSEYRMRHGEAVAIGMSAAAVIAQLMGMADDSVVTGQRAVLRAFGLPVSLPPGAEPATLMALTTSDKKIHDRRIRWVLPTAIGSMQVRADVPARLVLEALRTIQEPID
ncbi:MAG: hypothetical protein NVS2B7_24700 [Herpetosiphon sp.]